MLRKVSTDHHQRAGAIEQPVLVVDDEANIRLTIAEALRDDGYPVIAASSGEEALAVLYDRNISLVLLDLRLGDMSGLDVLKRARDAGCDATFVIITAHGSISSAVETMKHGAVEYLQKPFTPSELREIVHTVESRGVVKNREEHTYDHLIELAMRAIRHSNLDAARRHVANALQLETSRPEAYNLMGVIHEKEGDRFEAQQCYRKALELDSTYQPARVNLHESVELGEGGSFILQETKKNKAADRKE